MKQMTQQYRRRSKMRKEQVGLTESVQRLEETPVDKIADSITYLSRSNARENRMTNEFYQNQDIIIGGLYVSS